MGAMATRIVVADGEPLFREGLVQLLSTQQDFRVVGEAADTVEALERVWRDRPNLVLMTLDLPPAGGQETARRIRRINPEIKIIMLAPPSAGAQRTVMDDVHSVVPCSARASQIFERIRAMSGRGEPPPGPVTELAPRRDVPAVPDSHALTPRQKEVLALLARAWSNRDIEEALGIRNSTVKRHVRHILRKLHVNNRVQAALYAYRMPHDTQKGALQ